MARVVRAALMLPLISLTLGISFLSGLNLYLVTFLTSLAVQQGWIDSALHPAVAALGHPAVLVLSLGFFLTEFIIDKIPWVDSLWDSVHTVVRPVGAGMLSFIILRDAGLTSDSTTAILAGLGGVIALSTHLTKSAVRLLLNASPEPFSNILASLAEDITVACLLLLLFKAPVTGFAACLVLLAGTWMVLPHLLRILKTSLWLMWKKFTAVRSAPLPPDGVLPNALTIRQEKQLYDLLETEASGVAPAAAWAVPCITGKIRQFPSLRAHRFGTLVLPAQHPGTLAFLQRGWLRHDAVSLSLAGCTVRHETTILSENLVIHHAVDGPQVVFRFIRGEALLVADLVADLRCRLGLEAPAIGSTSNQSLPSRATTVWTAPPGLRH